MHYMFVCLFVRTLDCGLACVYLVLSCCVSKSCHIVQSLIYKISLSIYIYVSSIL